MSLIVTLSIAVFLLAYSNGANDNFKGVASLYGSGTCSYRVALRWATAATALGSITSIVLATALLKKFCGRGLVDDALATSPEFILAVALGAAITVMLATRFGFPISTTHALTGGLTGAGLAASPAAVNFQVLQQGYLTPLLISPVLAFGVGAGVYLICRWLRVTSNLGPESCVCMSVEHSPVKMGNSAALLATPTLTITAGSHCDASHVVQARAKPVLDTLHMLSAGALCFARSLNDTPKIAALLLVTGPFDKAWALTAVGLSIGVGGWLNSKRVGITMSQKLTSMNGGQGFAANLSTTLLVLSASLHGVPVSTTHVGVGSLLGMGTVTGQAKWRTVLPVLASWVITLPLAATVGALILHLLHSSKLP